MKRFAYLATFPVTAALFCQSANAGCDQIRKEYTPSNFVCEPGTRFTIKEVSNSYQNSGYCAENPESIGDDNKFQQYLRNAQVDFVILRSGTMYNSAANSKFVTGSPTCRKFANQPDDCPKTVGNYVFIDTEYFKEEETGRLIKESIQVCGSSDRGQP
jgi:hypothetical protein